MEHQQTPDPSQDRAPPPYIPMSGMAIFAFVLSLLGIVGGLFFWWIQLIPIALGVIMLTTVSRRQRRGHALAWWAIGIAVATGVMFFQGQSAIQNMARQISGSVLTALSSEATDAEKDSVLKGWMLPSALEEDDNLLSDIRARYARVQAEFGAYKHPPEVGGAFAGWAPMMVPPTGVTEVGVADGAKPMDIPMPLECIWVTARFEKATLHVALQWFGGKLSRNADMPTGIEEGAELPIVSDVRFFKVGSP